MQIAQRILNLNYDPQMGELNFLKDITLEELMQINGIGRVKAIQLKAVCELAIRMSKPSNYKRVRIRSTEDLAKLVMEELNVASGGTNFVNINMKEIIGEALKIQAPKMILVHNHPTGDPTPSKIDIKFTDKLYNAAKMFDIELMDHIVIGNNNFKSVFVETQKMVERAICEQ